MCPKYDFGIQEVILHNTETGEPIILTMPAKPEGNSLFSDFDPHFNAIAYRRETYWWEFPEHKHFYYIKHVEPYFPDKEYRFACETCQKPYNIMSKDFWKTGELRDTATVDMG